MPPRQISTIGQILIVFCLVTAGTSLIGAIQPARAATMAEQYAGKILIDAPRAGDIWYVHPTTKVRYYLGTDVDAEAVIRQLAVKIHTNKLVKIPTVDENIRGDAKLRKKFTGYFLNDVDGGRQLWYVSPWVRKRKLFPPTESIHDVLVRFGIQGSNAILRGIPLAADSLPGPAIPPKISIVKKVSVTTTEGTFTTTQIILDRRNQHWQILTDTGDVTDCGQDCNALSVREYVQRNNGVAGIQGTYFCTSWWCGESGLNSFLWPVFNSSLRTMINQARVYFTADPMIIFDTSRKPYYLPAGSDFVSLEDFERRMGVTVQAAISNTPAMVAASVNILNESYLNSSLRYSHATRAFIGWRGTYIYLVSVRSATIPDATAVAMAMGLEYALNLDGGSSSGMFHDGSYLIGPGRNVPNAIVVVPK